jgi:hypothetical protein
MRRRGVTLKELINTIKKEVGAQNGTQPKIGKTTFYNDLRISRAFS